MTPVTATYSQIGYVNLANRLCLSKLRASARENVKSTIGVSVGVDVVAPEGVERSMGKMRRIVDRRR